MEHRDNIRNNVNVVTRLRLTFALVVLILGISALFSGYLLFELKKSQRNAIENSIPTLSQAHEIKSQIVSIDDLTARLESVTNAYKVSEMQVDLRNQKDALGVILQAKYSNSDHHDFGIDEFRESAKYLDTSVTGVVAAKLTMLEMDEAIHTKLAQIKSIRAAFGNQFEPLSSALATALNDSLNTIAINPTKTQLTKTDLVNNISDQNQLSELAFGVSALIDRIEMVPTSYNKENQAELEAELNTRFTKVEALISEYNDQDNQRSWSSLISGLRGLTLGERGLLDNIETQRTATIRFKSTHSAQLSQVKIFLGRIDEVVIATTTEILSTTSNFNRLLNQIIFTLVLFGCVVVGIIALVNYAVVERQINRRMQRLTSAVLDIANGNHDLEVDVSGQDELGNIAGALEVFKQNAKELQRSNIELEQFAYAAAHDLRSPLRAIESLATWTLEDSGDDLPAEAKSNLEQLLVRANRLSRLQNDLLDYSRVGNPDDSMQKADFQNMVDDVAEMIDPDHHFKITVGRAPVGLSTQMVPLKQIILNLITNAIKHHDKAAGSIQIDIDADNDRLRISVSDDGPGIPTEFHERIFGLFEKLEARDKVEGSGLGLSLVKKMVERSKGSIAVASDPSKNRGSTFLFDWPYSDAAATESGTEDHCNQPLKKVAGL